MKKQIIFYALVLCNFIICCSLSVITPFYPPFAIEQGLSEEVVGLVISANPLGAFFVSLILGKILNEHNRFFYMNLGLMIQASGMIIFAMTYFVHSYSLFLGISLVARVMSGMGATCFTTPFYAYIPILYPEEVEKKMAISELFAGIGFLVGIVSLILNNMQGPILGSILYGIAGYLSPFLSFAGLIFILAPFIYIFVRRQASKTQVYTRITTEIIEAINESPFGTNIIDKQSIPQTPLLVDSIVQQTSKDSPSSINEIIRQQSPDQPRIAQSILRASYPSYSHKQETRIEYLQVLFQYPILLTFLVNVVTNFVIMYFAPTLSAYLQGTYEANPTNVGFMMSVYAFTFTCTSLFITQMHSHKRLALCLATFLLGFSFFFMGPDQNFTGLRHNLYVVLVAQGFIGIGIGFGFILSMPTFNRILHSSYPNNELQCANISSALFNSSMCIGELIGPTMSGVLTKNYGFERGCSFTGIGIIVVGMLYVPVVFHKLPTYDKKSLDVEK